MNLRLFRMQQNWSSIHIYTLQLLWTHLCFYLTCFPKSQTEIRMITDVWVWIGFGWIFWWCVPCFCLHKDKSWWESYRNVPASLTPRQFLMCSLDPKELLSCCWQRTLCVPSRTLPPPLGWSRKVQSYHQCIARRSLQCGKLQQHTNSQLRGTYNVVRKRSWGSL